jgi:glutathione S-transferase
VLDDGESVIESAAILDYLDERAGPSRALIAEAGPTRRQALKVCALATGLNDKAVSLVYERVLHKETSDVWVKRCEAQIGAVLDILESERARRSTPYWFGDSIGHADIAVACALRFLGEAHPALLSQNTRPVLAAHAVRCEALPVFKAIVQPFLPPS